MELDLAARSKTLELIGVGVRECCRRNLRRIILIVGGAGMGEAVVVGAERAVEISDGATFGGFRWTQAADWVERAVRAAIHHSRHPLGHNGDLAVERARRCGEQL